MKFLVILIIIKIFAQINIFKHIGEKNGQYILRNVRSLEHIKKKYSKVNQDIRFIKTCRRENLIPTFAKVKIAFKINNSKLKQKLARIKLDTKLQQKHKQRRKLKREVIKLCNDKKQSISSVLFNAIIYYLDKSIKLKASFIKEQHNKKLYNLLRNDELNNSDKTVKFIRYTAHNYSSYIISREDKKLYHLDLMNI